MGEQLKPLRKRNKLTRKEAAELLQISLRSYKSSEYPVEYAYLFESYAKNKAKEESAADLGGT